MALEARCEICGEWVTLDPHQRFARHGSVRSGEIAWCRNRREVSIDETRRYTARQDPQTGRWVKVVEKPSSKQSSPYARGENRG